MTSQPDEIRVSQEIIDLIVLIGKDASHTRIQRCVSMIYAELRTVSDRAYREGQESMMCTVIKRMKKCEWWCVCGECNFKKEILSLKPTPRDV